jgi:hypothetical protein
VLAAEHLLRLARVDLARQVVETGGEVVADGFARFGPLGEHGKVVDAPLQRLAQRDVVFEAAPPLQQLLRGGLVLPEVRFADALLDFLQFVGRAGGVKDSSADRPRVLRGPDTAGAAPLVAAYRWQMAKGESVSAVAAG